MAIPYWSASKKKFLDPNDRKEFNDFHLTGAIKKLTAVCARPHPDIPEVEVTRTRLILESLKVAARKRGL